MARPVRALRKAMRECEGELRDVTIERLRHAARRLAAAGERDKRERLVW